MKFIKYVLCLVLAVVLLACGGGNKATPTATVPGPTSSNPTISVTLKNSSGAVASSITASDVFTLYATVRNANGIVLAGQVVTFTGDSALFKFSPVSATALTDANGIASVQVSPALSSSAGAALLTADVSVDGVAATQAKLGVSVVLTSGSGGVPSMTIGLRDVSNASTSTISRTATTTAQIQLLTSAGVPPPVDTFVTVTSDDTTLLTFPSGATGLTNSTGIANVAVKVNPASAGGTSTLRATAKISGASITASVDFLVFPAGSTAGVATISLGLAGGGNSILASGFTTAQATVKDANDAVVPGKLVTFTGDTALIKFSPSSGQVLTNTSGVASIQVSPLSLSSAGASTLAANATVGTADISASFDFQLADANLGLNTLTLGTDSLPAFGSRPISVTATINGALATAVPVQVTFNASCGTAIPATVTTDASGVASTTYTASLAACAGTNVTITASAVGAVPLSGTIPVAASIASNVLFISTSQQLIYLKDSVGATQAQVTFKVVDSNGNPLQNKKLRLSLSNTATGVTLDTLGNTAPVDLSTDSTGVASVAVFSGTVPTSLNVKATLLDASNNPTSVFSNSNLLTVASGRPVQKSLSLALGKLSIEAKSRDGQETAVTLSMADRQGNPVPPGTQVNFVTESGGLQPATCFVPTTIPPESFCSVTFRSSGTRTANGRVSILAYVDGEEDFVDGNGNNVYDSGESFTDLGWAYRDDNNSVMAGVDGG